MIIIGCIIELVGLVGLFVNDALKGPTGVDSFV